MSKLLKRSYLHACLLFHCCCSAAAVAQTGGNGQPLGVTVQLPTLGVSIDSAGILSTKVFSDPDGAIVQERLVRLRTRMPQDLLRQSRCRKISLKKLQTACFAAIRDSGNPTPVMKALAGLTRIEYVFVLPDQNDIVIAGPAEPWIENVAGRNVGIYSALPILNLSDFAVAVRCFPPAGKQFNWVACSIDPTPQGIQRLQQFNRNLPKQIQPHQQAQAASVFREQMQEALGLASVNVYGIDPRTHAAQIMIEADYRMKLMAVGLEDPLVPRLTTFIEALTGSPKDLQRWWLTPDYKCLKQAGDGLSVQFIGRGVSLQTENIVLGANANIQRKPTKPSRAARIYAKSFTENFDALASVKPVFAQLRNLVDCLIAAAWIRNQTGWKKCDLDPELFTDETRLPTRTQPAVRHAKCVANAVWKRHVLLLPAGGGVSISPGDALKSSNVKGDSSQQLKAMAQTIDVEDTNWWWD